MLGFHGAVRRLGLGEPWTGSAVGLVGGQDLPVLVSRGEADRISIRALFARSEV